MEMRRLTVYGVLQEGLQKTFKHFFVCLKGLVCAFLVGLAALSGLVLANWALIVGAITLAGLVLINWPLLSKIIKQAPEFMGKVVACGDNESCVNGVLNAIKISDFASPMQVALLVISAIIAYVIIVWLMFGLMRYFLAVYDTGSASIKDLFSPAGKTVHYIIAGLLYGLIIAGGLILLIIPGIYWGIRFGQFSYFILDRNAGIIQSLKMSWAATSGYGWQIFFLMIIIHIMSRIGSYFIIPRLITIPAHFIIQACIYRKLTATTEVPGLNPTIMQM